MTTPEPKANVARSYALYDKARAIIPGGTQTISKRPERYAMGEWPVYWEQAQGAHIWDVDGNQYTDYVMALGPIVLGYSQPAVDAAIAEQLRKGMLSSLQSPLEVTVAEKLIEHVPSAEMVRFAKTGAEATSMAVRLSRTYTGREKVISCGYAGWHDWWVAKQRADGTRGGSATAGVPKALTDLAFDVAYGDTRHLDTVCSKLADDLACIIIDPAEVDDGGVFLRQAQQLARRHGAVLILDEIITGFRMGLGGAQEHFGVTPDLSTFGKAIANGMPLSAVVGRKDVMEAAERTWISSTFGGEALSLAAAVATISELEKPHVLKRLWDCSDRLADGFEKAVTGTDGVETFGLPSMPGIRFVDGTEPGEAGATEFVGQMLRQGFLTRPNYVFFVTSSLTDDDVTRTLHAVESSIEAVASCAA